MKTQELLSTPEAVLVSILKDMKVKELEKHGKKIAKKMGLDDYQELTRHLIKVIPQLNQEDNRFEKIKEQISALINEEKTDIDLEMQEESEKGMLDRLTIITTLLISKKLNEIKASL